MALLACLAVVGCGSDEQLAAGTAERLHDAVATARAAAADGDRAAALRALDRLGRRVTEAEREGELAEAEAEALRHGVARARARVRQEVEAPAPAPTATSEPTATPEPTVVPDEDEEEEDEDDEESGEGPPGLQKKDKAKGKDR